VSRSDRILVAACGGALVLAVAAATILVMPAPAADSTDDAAALIAEPSAVALADSPTPAPADPAAAEVVVDVQGAVVKPGIRSLPGGSRVGDAVAAAGGYAPDADLDATARTINLAQPLTDGQQIIVPSVADAVAPSTAAGATAASGGGSAGLVDLNTASAEELEALPGIGEVTVEKIMAARAERPFSSLEELVERGVIHNGQLEDIRGLATAG
jgi:competence protein ComEA